jgi:hypothetical protein
MIGIRASPACRPRGFSRVPTIRALFETTFFVGLRKAAVPEE